MNVDYLNFVCTNLAHFGTTMPVMERVQGYKADDSTTAAAHVPTVFPTSSYPNLASNALKSMP